MSSNRNGGQGKKKGANGRFRDDDTDRLSDEIEPPSSSKPMTISHQLKKQYARSTRKNDFYDEEYIFDDEESSIQEDHDYISIDNNDSDDEDFGSQHPRRLSARGAQGFPDVEIYAYLPKYVTELLNLK